MSISEDIAKLEEALSAGDERDSKLFVYCSPDRIRRVLDALKESRKWHQTARLLHEQRDARLSKAIDLLKEAQESVGVESRTYGPAKRLRAEIDAFLSQDSQA